MASRNADPALCQPLLNAIADFAAAQQKRVHCLHSDTSPYFPLLAANGYQARPRHFVILAQLPDPQFTARNVWRPVPSLERVRVVAWTPGGEWTLHEPAERTERSLRLEMKDKALTRMLMGRLRLSTAVEMETVTLLGAHAGDLAALDTALPFAPWCYHAIDYL